MIAATVLLGVALLATAFLARRCGILRRFGDLGAVGRRSVRMMGRRGASDGSKERAARLLAARMMNRSLVAGGLLAFVALPVAAALVLGPPAGVPTVDVLFDPLARIQILAFGISLVLLVRSNVLTRLFAREGIGLRQA